MSWIVVEKSRDQENTFERLESDNFTQTADINYQNSEGSIKLYTTDNNPKVYLICMRVLRCLVR